MALTREKKEQVVEEVNRLLSESKMTIVAKYQGTPVKSMQALRRLARDNNTVLKVVKNRLFRKALAANDIYKHTDAAALEGMLLYAFNSEDEVAPAKTLADFAKQQPTIEFIGAFNSDGKFMSSDEVKELADLPGKNELIAQVVSTLQSPVNDLTNGLSGNLQALLDGIEAKAAA